MINTVEELKRDMQELRLKNELFPSYLSGLSHDIRTPLNSIIGFADLLNDSKVSRADQRLYSQLVARSSRKLLDLMSNLIDLAKMETRNLVIYEQSVSIRELTEELSEELEEMKGLYGKSEIVVRFSVDPDVPESFRSDKNRVFQILRILMENSLKFTQSGKIELEIKNLPNRRLSFRVVDTGCGMSQEAIDGLFELFPPLEVLNGKKIKARGLSLLVVKKLCDLLSASIRIISEPTRGTAITIILPT